MYHELTAHYQKINKSPHRDLFVHFCDNKQAEIIQKESAIIALNHESVYAYNVAVTLLTRNNSTLPRKILENLEDHVAVVFTDNPGHWWHYQEESCTSYHYRDSNGGRLPISDYIIIPAQEAFDFLFSEYLA